MTTPSLQWDLARTGESALSIATNFVRASTSDNVQILALIACERFGATLAMCPATCEKVESLINKAQTRTTRVVGFLSAVVGYSTGDCASQLAGSLAGIQFIGLAATLMPSIGAYHGGEALALMLKKSAGDKLLLPSGSHLKALLASLEHRCLQLGFTNLIFSWIQILCTSPSTSAEERQRWKLSDGVPNAEGLNMLVEALRSLSRIGNAASITIKSDTCTPWIAAFVEWCCGIPPSVLLEDGRLLHEETSSKITLVVSFAENRPAFGFELHIYKNLRNPTDLIVAEEGIRGDVSRHPWSGMVTIEKYGQWLLQEYDFDIGVASRAIVEALPYCMKQVITQLCLSNLVELDRSIPFVKWQTEACKRHIIDPTLLKLAARPFPRDRVIAAMLSRMVNSPHPLEIRTLADGLLISDLPLMKMYLKDLKETCRCQECATSSSSNKFASCVKTQVLHRLSFFVADVLALSLYDFPELLLVQLNRLRSGTESLKSAVFRILLTGERSQCHLSGYLQAALNIVGHNSNDAISANRWVMSCYKGQAVYPRIFETFQLEDEGYLTLSWAQGLLRYQGVVYAQALARLESNSLYRGTSFQKTGVISASNLFPGHELTWRIMPEDDLLEIFLSILDPAGSISTIIRSPCQILTTLATALIVRACPHPASSTLPQADPFCEFSHYLQPLFLDTTNGNLNLAVVPVNKNNGLRMISMASHQAPFPVVLRGDACLSCCLEVCRRAAYPVVIC